MSTIKRIRKGKTLNISFTVTTNGESLSLEGRNLTLELVTRFNERKKVPFIVSGSQVSLTFQGRDQKSCGVYTITLWENLDEDNQTVVDICDGFELVPLTCQESEGVAENLEVESLDLGVVDIETNTIIHGNDGKSAYEIWLEQGHEGTKEDFLNWLRQPAVDATNDLVKHIVDKDNPHKVTKSQVGLGNVDNTSDKDKPVSDAVTIELSKKQDVLVSGENIKTINGESILGSGDVVIDLSLYKVVSELPAENIDANKIYLVLNVSGTETNTYDEYAYVNGEWELLGQYKAAVDLTPYLTKEEAENTYATKQEVKEAVDTKQDATDDHLQTENKTVAGAINEVLAKKQDATDSGLDTPSKTIVEAINQLYGMTKDLSNLYYGVEYDVTISSPDCRRIGNPEFHRSLPIHNRMKGCLLSDEGTVTEYLNPADWRENTRDGSRGQVMVELPMYYRKFETDGNIRRVKLSEYPLPGYHQVKQKYVSAYEATVQRSTTMLCSVANEGADYRGGDNQSDWDGTYRSLLGKPATGISLTDYRSYARKRKPNSTEWNCMTYDIQKDLFWLYIVEFATLNSQKAVNSEKDANGYAQGGLGYGVSTLDWDKWKTFNNTRPFIPCGYTDELGNGTGEIEFSMPAEYDTINTKVKVPRYRGVENPFGHIWKWTDGVIVRISPTEENGGDGLSKVFVIDNPKLFNNSNYNGYQYVGNEARTEAYVKEVIFGEGGEIIPDTVGGEVLPTSATTIILRCLQRKLYVVWRSVVVQGIGKIAVSALCPRVTSPRMRMLIWALAFALSPNKAKQKHVETIIKTEFYDTCILRPQAV